MWERKASPTSFPMSDTIHAAVASILGNQYNPLNAHNWTTNLPAPLSETDHKRFQDKLDELVGVNDDGSKRLRLVWNPHHEMWDSELRKWRPILFWKDEFEGLIHVEGIDHRKTVAIGAPRYLILGRTPPEKQTQTKNQLLTETKSWMVEVRPGVWERETSKSTTEERAGADEWKKVLTVCQHSLEYDPVARSPKCCLRRTLEKRIQCFGDYRPPDEMDLEVLAGELNFWADKLQAAAHQAFTEKDKAVVFSYFMNQINARQAAVDAEATYVDQSIRKDFAKQRVISLPKGH